MLELDLAGGPAEMGLAHGETLRPAIWSLAAIRHERLRSQTGIAAADLDRLCRTLLAEVARQTPAYAAELEAIARGANLTPSEVRAEGAVTDLADLAGAGEDGSECTTVAVSAAGPGGAPLVFGTWDSHPEAQDALTLVRRRLRGGPDCLGLTSAGAPVQQGINTAGLAFATNNLKPSRPAPGVVYIGALAALAETSSVAESTALLEGMTHAAGHYYPCADARGAAAGLETHAGGVSVIGPDGTGCIAHTNHYLDPRVEGVAYSMTVGRLAATEVFLRSWRGAINEVWAFLSDHKTPVCRHDNEEVRTCAALVFSPIESTIEVTDGPPCSNERRVYRL